MKFTKQMTLGAVLILGLFSSFGCSSSGAHQMVNELQFSLDGISTLTISYDEENITFHESPNDLFIIKEYMTKNNKKYHAKVTQQIDGIQISEGGKPFAKDSFSRYIEVYLPSSYHENLHVTSTNGDIDFTGIDLDVSMLRVDNASGTVTLDNVVASDTYLSSTRGTLKLGMIEADQIRLETTSGTVTCDELNGSVTYKSTSGDIDVKSAIGSGSYRANNSGKLSVVYTEVIGDLSFFNKNDNISVTLPADLNFNFEATTKNGSVSTNFQQSLTVNGRTTSGVVGTNPTVTVKVETTNGSSEVKQ